MVKVLSVYKKIEYLRRRYYNILSGKNSLLALISETEVAEQVYNSNAIEQSILSFEETEKILLQIDLDRYVSDRDIFEAKNLARVVSYIDNKAKEQDLNLDIILFLHKILLSNIRDDVAGRLRNKDEYVKVGNHIAPSPHEVKFLLEQALAEYFGSNSENIIKRIAKFHLGFENIHPFVDGNGRIGRVINNYLLIREGYVAINIKFIDRKKYYQAFRNFDLTGDTSIMEEIVGRALVHSYNKRLAYMEDKKIIKLSEYAKINKISYTNLLNKAGRQTISAFMEKGVWKIGIDAK